MATNNAPLSGGVTGVLLAGGRARRFGGEDKGMLPLAGKPLAHWAATRLAAQTDAVCVVANRHRDRYAALGHPVIADEIAGFAGPLAGIHAGMLAAKTEWVLSAPCDSPFLPADLATRLAAAAIDDVEVVVAVAGGRKQSVFLLARRRLAADIADFLTGGDGKIENWRRRLNFAEAVFADASAFDNVNKPEDLRAATARLARQDCRSG